MERRYNTLVHQVNVWTGLPPDVRQRPEDPLDSIIFAVALRGLGSTSSLHGHHRGHMVLYSFMGGR